MKSAQIVLTIVNEFRNRKLWGWILILTISAAGPLLATYIFSRGIAALETSKSWQYTLLIFFFYFLIQALETVMRVGSKTRIHVFIEKIIVKVQHAFITQVPARDKFRSQTIQATRNLTDALNVFATYFINNSITGMVSFISVPVLLAFIDMRIFVLEIVLMVVYLTGTYLIGRKYEEQYENFDAAKEKYFSKVIKSNKIEGEGKGLIKEMDALQNIRFVEWTSLQNLIIVFKFLVIILVTVDILNGLKSISDLVLIVGYTNQSKSFLNSVTGTIERFMQIVAGVDRLVIVTHKAPKGSVTKIA